MVAPVETAAQAGATSEALEARAAAALQAPMELSAPAAMPAEMAAKEVDWAEPGALAAQQAA